jgi:hypothetical protein
MIKLTIAVLCVSLLAAAGCGSAADSTAARTKELASVLKPVQKPGSDSETNPQNPGYYDLANRERLRDFINKYPGTEEALHAEVWLAFAEAITERRLDPLAEKRLSERRAQRMKEIATKAADPATAKIATLLRAGDLSNASDWAECEKQLHEIVAHAKEYESETNKNFLSFCKLDRIPVSEIEPFYRIELIANACYEGRLDKALALAEELQQKFPEWSKRERFAGTIDQLKRGRSPYPKMTPF